MTAEPEGPGYWVEVHPSGWPHRRIPTSEPVTPEYRAQWISWGGPGPVPPMPDREVQTAWAERDLAYEMRNEAVAELKRMREDRDRLRAESALHDNCVKDGERSARKWREVAMRAEAERDAARMDLARMQPVVQKAMVLHVVWLAAEEDDDWYEEPFLSASHEFLAAVKAFADGGAA